MCLFATQLNILCCVCVAHAQDLHWLLKTGRRIWQKSVSSVRRICSILFSMPVTPSAEVHPHKHTCLDGLKWLGHAFQSSSTVIEYTMTLCFSLQKAEVIPSASNSHTISALSLVPCNTTLSTQICSIYLCSLQVFSCVQRLLCFLNIFNVFLPWTIQCSYGTWSL